MDRAVDFYRLLRIDPDAPQEVVTEAYWLLAGGIRDRLSLRQGDERDLDALNNAYAVLVDPGKREAYDETVSRVVEIRRERADRRRSTRQPLLARLLVKPRPQTVDPYELLRVDPAAGPALITRAYLVLRTLYSTGKIAGSTAEQLELLAKTRSELLERFAKGASSAPRGVVGEPSTEPPDFLTKERVSGIPEERK
ncbi:MAG: DnaJ domain-containing protein [Dehalococcoidia bacterium]